MNRVFLHVGQRVVHPAHVPLHREAEAAHVRRARDLRPVRRFFRDDHRAGERGVRHRVQLAQELDGFEVVRAAVLVRHELAGLLAEIEIEHRRHRVHPQPVEMKLVQPVIRAR